MKKIFPYLLLTIFVLSLFFTACEPLDIKRVAKIKTGSAIDSTFRKIVISGQIIDEGEGLFEVGHCWSTDPEPKLENSEHALSINGLKQGDQIFTVLDNLWPGQTYYVRAYAITNNQTVYGNEILVQTQAIPENWTISIQQPINNEFWPLGTKKNIEWISLVRDTFVIGLYDESIHQKLYDIAKIPSQDGTINYSYEYSLPDDGTLQSQNTYGIKIESASYVQFSNTLYDVGLFYATKPNIQIIKPNINSKWNKGREYTIEWSKVQVFNVDIKLLKDNNLLLSIAEDVQNDIYNWYIPDGMTAGQNYQIAVYYRDFPEFADTSDVFEILNFAFINISEPNGSTSWTNGSQQTITWTDNIQENVNIELTNTSSLDKYNIATDVLSNGTYNYTPNVPAGTYVLTIYSPKDAATVNATSDSFTIN